MGLELKELVLSKEVATATEECVSYVPASGATIIIKKFSCRGAFSKNAVVKLVWDFAGAGETLIWSDGGNGEIPFSHTILSTDTDGVKKLSVCLDNGETVAVYLSGYALLEVST